MSGGAPVPSPALADDAGPGRLPRFMSRGLMPHPDVPSPFRDVVAGAAGREVGFDPARHLQIELPGTVKTLDFKTVEFPYNCDLKENFPGLAYTEPFRLLSDEGVTVLRSIIDTHKDRFLSSNERLTGIRGLGYLSKFVRDFSYCPEVVEAFSQMARESVWPHPTTMNLGHTNFGMPGSGKSVDQWHVDSVDYVFVLILSDIKDMKGGELQVLQMPDASGKTFDRLIKTGIPKELVDTISYSRAGYCIFMQGSKILHSVTPVLRAREPRISFVQSWSNLNVFSPDRTRLHCFREQMGDPAHIANLEYARYKAWRIMGQMTYLKDKLQFDKNNQARLAASIFQNAASELLRARDLLLGIKSDLPGFIVHAEDKITATGRDREDKYADAPKSRL